MIAAGKNAFRSWFERDFIILDTETTHLNGEIVEIGIIDRYGNVIFQSMVKPVVPVADDSAIHGITNAELESAPAWKDIRDEIQALVRGKLILMFNANFDRKMINHSCERNYVNQLEGVEWDCVMEAYRLTQGSEKWISLQNASGRYSAHRAIEDCLSTLAVIKEQWEEQELIQSRGSIHYELKR